MNELQRLIASNGAFAPPPQILDAIPSESRDARPAGVTHSIAEELWHIVYWFDRFLAWARRESLPYPISADEGWWTLNAVTSDEWDFLQSRFSRNLDEAVQLAAGSPRVLLAQETTCREPGRVPLTMYEALVDIAVHNAYHLGRVVQLRQMLGIWPPPGGGDRW